MARNTSPRLLIASFSCLASAILLLSCAPGDDTAARDEAAGFVSLFDGRSLDGWVQRGGQAVYSVEDGAIVGRTVLDTPNSFLCTSRDYEDFVLRFEVKVDPELNSGVQIRSHSTVDYQDGRVYGYQVEIDPTDRGYSGGVYDEARRGWLQNPEGNEEAMKAFRPGEWNAYEIEAVGDQIKTWVNGVLVTDLVDGVDRSGFIGLQVHASDEEGLEVRWRNLELKELPPVTGGQFPNTLTREEREAGWRLLWDGRTTWGWRGARSDTFPEKGWEIAGGVLTVLETGGGEAEAGGDIVTVDQYADFELRLEFRLTRGANSGIKYFVDPELNKGKGSAIGLEYQILDDAAHPDAAMGRDGNRTLASLYDLIPASSAKVTRPIGDWNEARIVSRGHHVEHWLNGEQVLEYERGSEEFRKLVARSKYKVWKNFGEAPEGHILLQDHGNRVSFRNIEIRTPEPPATDGSS
jgi:hypothetical protein